MKYNSSSYSVCATLVCLGGSFLNNVSDSTSMLPNSFFQQNLPSNIVNYSDSYQVFDSGFRKRVTKQDVLNLFADMTYLNDQELIIYRNTIKKLSIPKKANLFDYYAK